MVGLKKCAYTQCMLNAVRVVAPCRADLAGGTLDIWPLGLLHPGSVTVNLALPVLVDLTVKNTGPEGVVEHRVEPSGRATRLTSADADRDLTAAVAFSIKPEGGVQVHVKRQAPIGSGLGGSSSYGIALARALAALDGQSLGDTDLVTLVKNLEARILATPTGCQDHWGAVAGGVLALHLEAQGERLERLDVDHHWLGDHITLFFSGITHNSGMVNWQVVRRRLDHDPETTEALENISRAARECRAGLLQGDRVRVGRALRHEWQARKRLAPEVCPTELEEIERVVAAAGAIAFKACGAGGGGSVLIWHQPEHAAAIADALQSSTQGGFVLPRGVAPAGCRVETVIG